MIKLVLTIFCGSTICWKHVASGSSLDLPMKRKASLFLQNKAIPGLAGISPENDMASMTNAGYFGGDYFFVDPELRATVLGGNYPEAALKILRPKMSPSESSQKYEGDDTDSQLIGKQTLNKKLILLDPVEELLLSKETNAENGTDGEIQVLEEKSIQDGFKSFLKKLLECKNKLIYCKKKNVILCYLHCLLNNNPLGMVIQSNVPSLLKTLCDPLGTVFDAGVKLFNKNFQSIKTINNFLTLLRLIPETFRRFTRLAANALPALLLKYSRTWEAGFFKTVLSGLETDAKAIASTTDITTELSNPGCPSLDAFNAIQRVVGIFFQNPKIVNVFLPGLWTISKIFRLTSVPYVKSSLQAFGGALSMLAGLNCGLIHFIITGSNTTCQEDDHVVWEATKKELVPPEGGIPAVCGSVPYISPRVILQDLFPPIFVQATTTASIAQQNNGNDSETSKQSAASKVASMTKDMRWVDDIIRTMDSDDF